MKEETLFKYVKENPDCFNFEIEGNCHDCGKLVNVRYYMNETRDNIEAIEGGCCYEPENGSDRFYFKCIDCFENNSILRNYAKCDIYARSVGYMRPVENWHKAKQAEFRERKMYNIEKFQ